MGGFQSRTLAAMPMITAAWLLIAVAETDFYLPYAGLDREIEMDTNVETAMAQLNRYCGSGSYSYYRPTYYRPSYSQPNYGPTIPNILTPVVFGLAAVTSLAAASSLFPQTTIVGEGK